MGGSDAPVWAAHGLTATDVGAEPAFSSLDEDKGGTGHISYAEGDMIYASGTTTLAKLAKGTADEFLRMGTSNIPLWDTITASDVGAATSGHTHSLAGGTITGTLPVNKGGTGATTQANARSNLGLTGNVTSHTHSYATESYVSTAVSTHVTNTHDNSDWDTAYSLRLQWNGGGTNLNASNGRSSLGLGSAATSASSAFATSGHTHSLSGSTITGTLPVSKGGTGATTLSLIHI